MTFSFDIAGSQINGARDYQEDAFLVTHLSGGGAGGGSLVAVADGMGGHAAGNVASNLAVQTFNKEVTARYPAATPAAVLRDAVQAANRSIRDTVQETSALQGMGCTFVGALVEARQLRWASVGDSHLYLLRGGALAKLNADHSYGGYLDRMAAAGTPVQGEAGFSRNMLMSALTGSDIPDIDCPESPFTLQAGDRILLASDGLDSLAPEQVTTVASRAATARECVEALLQAVTAAGVARQDNTTVVVIDVQGVGGAVRPAGSAAATATPPRPEGAAVFRSAPPSAPHPTPFKHPAPGKRAAGRRGRGPALPLTIAALVAVAGVGGWWWYANQPAPELAGPASSQSESPAGPTAENAPTTPAETPEPAAPAEPLPIETFREPLGGGGEGPEMVWLPAGRFTMGSSSVATDFDERPQRELALERFAIGRHEVTVAEYARFARATGRRAPGPAAGLDSDTAPVTDVAWDDALAYTAWLSRETGARYRLASEAEWEYAARGGSETIYAWGATPGSGNAWCFGCEPGLAPRAPTTIGQYPANAFGLHDMAGNVLEWVQDCYHPSYEGAPSDASAWQTEGCAQRVARGGSFMNVPKSVRPAKREALDAGEGYDNVGFRVVREP